MQITKKGILKITRRTLIVLLLLLVCAFGLLQIPKVQTKIAQKASVYLSQGVGYEITIEAIDVKWFDAAEITNLEIKDSTGFTFLRANSAFVDYQIKSLLNDSLVIIDEIVLNRPQVHMSWGNQSNRLNIPVFLKTFREFIKRKNGKKRKKKLIPIQINDLRVENGLFSYTDPRRSQMSNPDRFDHNYFVIDSIYGNAASLYIHRDTIQLSAEHVKAVETKTKFPVHDLNTNFRFTKRSLSFDAVDTYAGNSRISSCIQFDYDTIIDMSNFVQKVDIDAYMDSTVIHTKDLAIFAPAIKQYEDYWTIYGEYQGRVKDFKAKNVLVYFGQSSYINGRIALDGLPDITETGINLRLDKSRITPKDIRQYVTKQKYYKAFKKFGNIVFDADFQGYPTNFVAYGNFETALGKLDSDLQFKISDIENGSSEYKGHLQTNDFNLGAFLNRNYLGNISMNGELKGSGFTIENADILVNAEIDQLQVGNYNYTNMYTNATLSQEFFSGHFQIDDPNLNLNIDGELNLEDNINKFDIAGQVDYAQLQELRLTKDTAFVRGKLDLDFTGFGLDDIEGTASLTNGYVFYKDDSLKVTQFDFSSKKDSLHRTFDVHSSDYLNFHADGNFQFEKIIKDLQILAYEYYLHFQNDEVESNEYYANKTDELRDRYNINFNADLTNVEPLLNIFYPSLHISPSTKVHGTFSNGYTTQLNTYINADVIGINDVQFRGNTIEVQTSKIADSAAVLANFYVRSSEQEFNKRPTSEALEAFGTWDGDLISFSSSVRQFNRSNSANLHGTIQFLDKKYEAKIDSTSEVNLIQKTWTVDPGNLITFTKDNVEFENLSISNSSEEISLSGGISKENDKPATLEVGNFELKNLNSFLAVELNGKFTGTVDILDITNDTHLSGNMSVKNLSVNKEELGDFKGLISWSEAKNKLDTEVEFVKNGTTVGYIDGWYDTKTKAIDPLHFDAKLKNTSLELLEPFLFGKVTDVDGICNGKVNITGSLKDPNFQGKVKVWDGAFTIDYLKTRYQFEDDVYFDDDLIYVKNLAITDTAWDTRANVNGGITHKMFKKFEADVRIELDESLVLDTKAGDNELYYGTVFATGPVNILGPFSQLSITSTEVISDRGTRIFIPLEGTENIAKKDYISFVSRRNKDKIDLQKESNVNLSGIYMNFNMVVTEDAYFEIIFDEKAGDIIRGTGEGLMQMEVDTRGDFNMYGQYEITKGSYNFTLVNLINKKFDIEPNSKITWNGDPYEGQLDILAKYRQTASLSPIVDSTLKTQLASELSRNYPVEISLFLDGRLLSPEINFDVAVLDYPANIENIVESFHNRLQNNEQELNKQIFSLMVLKQLSPEQSFGNFASGSASSVSELFSNQFSYWISQFDENLEVDIDLSGFDNESNSTFRLRLSYSILDGRFRVTRDGAFTNVENQNDLANVFGEWTIEYLITDDGSIKLKAYNKTNQSTVSQTLNSSNNNTYGMSLTHTASFDRLGELFRKNPNKKEEDENTNNEDKKNDEDEE